MIADALIRSRAGTVDNLPPDLHKLRSVTFPAAIDEASQMNKWEPIVRFYVCLSELLGSVNFSVTSSNAAVLNGDGAQVIKMQRPDMGDVPFLSTSKNLGLFRKQMPLMEAWAELREDRATEIQAQMAPQIAFWSATCGLQPTRYKYTFEFLNLALAFAATSAFRFKNAFGCPRPVEYWPGLQPMIPTPEHSTYPCGHATEAFIAAHVLSALDGESARSGSDLYIQLFTQASRVAVNRTVAGVHFPIDNWAGEKLGTALSEYLLKGAGSTKVKGCTGAPFDGKEPRDYVQHGPENIKDYETYLNGLPTTNVKPLLAVAALYRAAASEWNQ